MDLETDHIWAERHRIVEDARELARQLLALAESAVERFPPAEEPVEPTRSPAGAPEQPDLEDAAETPRQLPEELDDEQGDDDEPTVLMPPLSVESAREPKPERAPGERGPDDEREPGGERARRSESGDEHREQPH
jgi:hypothetical protein